MCEARMSTVYQYKACVAMQASKGAKQLDRRKPTHMYAHVKTVDLRSQSTSSTAGKCT